MFPLTLVQLGINEGVCSPCSPQNHKAVILGEIFTQPPGVREIPAPYAKTGGNTGNTGNTGTNCTILTGNIQGSGGNKGGTGCFRP